MARRSPGDEPATAALILDAGERLAQQRGFNGFSYADIAGELGVSKAALHYHFASKADLGTALITRYAARFAAALDTIESGSGDGPSRLEGYIALYAEVLREERMCLCGMLAAEYRTLPEPMRDAVVEFFDRNERWLSTVLDEGRSEGSLRFRGPARDRARLIVGTLEGALLVARPYGDRTRFEAVARQIVEEVAVGAPATSTEST